MIEQALIFALGFLFAGLGALVLTPALWRRAMRLSTRRLQMQLPLSMEEIAAERDHVRAAAALQIRQAEQAAERAQALIYEDRRRLGEALAAATGLEESLTRMHAAHQEVAARLDQVSSEHAAAAAELGAAQQTIYAMDGQAQAQARLTDQLSALQARTAQASEDRRIAIAGLETRLAGLSMRAEDLTRQLAARTELADTLRRKLQSAVADRDLAAQERDNALSQVERAAGVRARLDERLKTLDEQLRAALAMREAAERDRRHIEQELTREHETALRLDGTLAETEGRLMALRERMNEQTRRVAGMERAQAQALEDLRSQKASLEGALDAARQEQARLRAELREAAAAPPARRRSRAAAIDDRADSVQLREAISALAAEVARLAAQAEGAESPILRLVHDSDRPDGPRSDLAERIRRRPPETVSTL